MLNMASIGALVMRICGGAGGFLFAKGWGFYPASAISSTEKKVFSHAYMQVIMIFVGEALTGFVALVDKKRAGAPFKVKNLGYFILPALLDGAAQTFSNLGIGGELISVQQVFRLSTILFVVPLLFFYAKERDIFRADWKAKSLAMLLMVCGLVTVGSLSVGLTGDMPDCGSAEKSMLFVLISGVFSALYTIAIRPYAKLEMHPLACTSIEACFGIVFYLCVLPILGATGLERPGEWVYQHKTGYILFNQVLFVACVFTVTLGGYLCVKKASSVAFQAIEAARPLLVMLVSLMAGWEKFEWAYSLGSVSSQVVIIVAYILYHEEFSIKHMVRNIEQSDALVVGTAMDAAEKAEVRGRSDSDLLT